RQCRAKTGFGAIVFDSATQTSKPLPPVQINNLITIMKEFQQLCTLDGGTMVGAEATQWARDATNMSEVKTSVKSSTSLDIEVLSPETEGIYGYVAATRNTAEKLAIDTGSNSFQLSWWNKGAAGPSAVSVPFGYVRGSATYYPASSTETYAAARQRHEADLKTKLDTALGALTPPMSLAQIKQSIVDGNVKGQVFVLGQDGAMNLVVRGELRDATSGIWLSSSDAYKARVAQELPRVDPTYGEIMSVLLPADLNNFFTTIMTADSFLALRTDPIRSLYGESALSNAALLDTLVKELGVTAIVGVPQEMPTGYILAKIQ
ncbi:MAG TPA: hypothetical protein VKP30_00840, partial [Polyangiaceae bacterium]|nr:hypothetical protein [Polyangiaceae bacterium]